MRKYYLAYEDRYKIVHANNLLWFIDEPSNELINWIEANEISPDAEICEIGCGEGRDAIYLAQLGFSITAIDISESGIEICKKRASELNLKIDWRVEDMVKPQNGFNRKFKWVFSIATMHMLIEEEDRVQFLKTIFNLLEDRGKLLLVNKGNGLNQSTTKAEEAFVAVDRTHMQTGINLKLPQTSFRQDNWTELISIVQKSGFKVLDQMLTYNCNYEECMTLYLEKR